MPVTSQNAVVECVLAFAVACATAITAGAQPASGVNPSNRFPPGACGPVDPSYIHTANETGGIPLFLQRSEVGKSMQLMRESTRENVSTLLWASAKLDDGMQKFEIPVDSVTERITFAFSVDMKSSRLALRGPNGQEIREGSEHTEDTELNCGRVITVEKPQAGSWRAEVSGSGTYWLQVQVQSDIYFISAKFVKLGGRPGHEGLFRIQGQPLAGEPATLQTSVSATHAETTDFSFVSEQGDLLLKLRMKASDEDREFLEFTGDVVLPSVPFRLSVSGRDTKGMQYQRFYGPLFHAESVEVIPRLNFDELAPGTTREAEFGIRNLGPARTFKVTVTDARRFVTVAGPRELAVGAHQTGLFKVQMTVPGGTAKGVEDDLVVIASSAAGNATTNSAVVRLSIADDSATSHSFPSSAEGP